MVEIDRNSLRQLPTQIDGNECYVCGPDNPHGLHMTFYTDSEAVYSWLQLPHHFCGWKNIVHGGVLATILDETMGWATLVLTRRFALTKETTLSFCKPILLDKGEMRVESRLVEYTSEREIVMEGKLYQGDSNPCVIAQGSYRVFTIESIIKLNILDKESLAWIQALLEQL